MTRNVLACLVLLGGVPLALAQTPTPMTPSQAPSPPPAPEWPVAKKMLIPEAPIGGGYSRSPEPQPGIKPTRHPWSIVWSSTNEFFDRPVTFRSPDAPLEPVDPVGDGVHLDPTAPGASPNSGTRLWLSAELMAAWVKDGPAPGPLVAVYQVSLNPPLLPIVDIGSGVPLFGTANFDYELFMAGRLTVGYWCECDQSLGIELSGLFLEQRPIRFFTSSAANGAPAIGRPFISAIDGSPAAFMVSLPGFLEGNIAISSHSQLFGLEANAVSKVYSWNDLNVTVLGGFRYLDLDENLLITQETTLLIDAAAGFLFDPLADGDLLRIVDAFEVRDRFLGPQVGAVMDYRYGAFEFSARGKLAIGGTRGLVRVSGVSLLNPGSTQDDADQAVGGFLAQTSNIGETIKHSFSIVPEIGLSASYDVCSCLSISFGWTAIWWNNVVRPGSQVDLTVNPNQIPTSLTYQDPEGTARPAPRFDRTSFWVQGISLGAEFRY